MNRQPKSRRAAAVGIAFIAALLLTSLLARPATVAADEVTAANLAQKIATATTAEDHQALASYYKEQAAAAAEKVKKHEAMPAAYQRAGGKPAANMKPHCQGLINSYKAVEKEYEALAELHAQRAEELKKK